MDIGDFLEFQRTLQRHRIIVSAAQVEEIARIGKDFGDIGDFAVVLQNLLDLFRNMLKLVHQLRAALVRHGSQLLCQAERQQEQGRHLRRKSLGGRNTDFRTDMRITARIGSPGDGRADHVADTEKERSRLAGQLDGSQGIGGFSGLRYRDDDVGRENDGTPVAEFRSIFHLHGLARELLDHIFTDEPGMPGSTAGADNDAFGAKQPLPVVNHAGEFDLAQFRMQAALHRGLQGPGLFENLLEHKVREAALFNFAQAHLQFADLGSMLFVAKVRDPQGFSPLDINNLLFAQIDDLVRIFDNRRRVGAHEVFILPYADNQRTALAGGNQLVRLVLVHNDQRISAHHEVEGQRNRLFQGHRTGIHHILDQLDDDLRIGLALEMIAFARQFGLEGEVILDDSVVNQRKVMVLGIMGMRVDVTGLAVGGPAGMGDPDTARDILVGRYGLQILDLALGLINDEFSAVADECHSGTVVTPVFQPGQAFN